MKYLLCHYMKECYQNKWIAPVDGNISFKHKNSDHFYITPASLRKQEINNEDIVKINISYTNKNIQYPFISIDPESTRVPSGELPLHSRFMISPHYRNQNICIVHCHPPYILAYIGLLTYNRELSSILTLFPELNVRIGKNVPYITAKTDKLGEQTYMNILNSPNKPNQIVALKQHGIVCVEENFQKVMEIIETLEYYSKIALLTQTHSLNQPLNQHLIQQINQHLILQINQQHNQHLYINIVMLDIKKKKYSI